MDRRREKLGDRGGYGNRFWGQVHGLIIGGGG